MKATSREKQILSEGIIEDKIAIAEWRAKAGAAYLRGWREGAGAMREAAAQWDVDHADYLRGLPIPEPKGGEPTERSPTP